MTIIETSKVVELAVKKIRESYELDADFVKSVQATLETSLQKYYIYDVPQSGGAPATATEKVTPAKKEKKPKKEKAVAEASATATTTPAVEKKPRAQSAYNKFVSAKMPGLKDCPPGERMGKIGAMWKLLSAEEKAGWKA